MIRARLKRLSIVGRVNSAVGGWIQRRTAERQQRDYERRAQHAGIQPTAADQLPVAVAQRLRSRGLTPRSIRKGDMHLFLTYQEWNWERVLPLSLAPFGEVSAYEWRSRGFEQSRRSDWAERRTEMNREMLEAFRAAHARRPVDAVVGYISGMTASPETVRAMGAVAPILNFCYDDKLFFPGEQFGGRWMSPAAIAADVDLNLTSAPSSIVKYSVHGGLAMFWPEAAHPAIHRPYELPFEYDVTFVGARYGWRPAFIAKLHHLGVRVDCFGNGWPNGPLSDEEMVKLYSRSRITLGFAGIGHSRKLMCLKGRDFEVPMSGGLYLTQDNPELQRVFDVGREIVTYADEGDCARKIRHLLEHPDEAAAIRQAGRARALRDHTYEVRWGQAFRAAGLIADP